MKNFFPKFSAILFIISVNFLLILFVFVLIYEKFDFNKKDNSESSRYQLGKTEYYGNKIDFDPYLPFDIRYLHPYYLASLPFIDEHIQVSNNRYVSIDSDGFRNNPFNSKNNKKSILLLGGSTAFGHFSSSDETSISAFIAKNSDFNVINRNAPGWNSSQELISLLKYNKKYSNSISLSIYNDLNQLCKDNYRFLRAKSSPSRFFYWSNVIENEKNINHDQRDLSNKIKYLLIKNFPKTKNLYKEVIKSFKNKSEFKNVSKKVDNQKSSYCSGDHRKIAEIFLENQKTMWNISNHRGARHILIIQPIYGLHEKTEKNLNIVKKKEALQFQKKVIKYLMEHKFCKNNCYDFSNIFDDQEKVELFIDSDQKIYNYEIFIDNVHLLDHGNKILAKKILNIEEFKN